MAMPSGSFEGHVFPGTLLLLWGLFWLGGIWRSRGGRPQGAPLEGSVALSVLKVALPLVGVALEWPGRSWPELDRIMNFQHVSMYAAFALSGVVDLLNRRGVLPRGATYVAFAGAAANAGMLFLEHGLGHDAAGTVHFLLAMLFFAAGAAALAEWLRPDLEVHWLRIGIMITLGGWFYRVAWILFRSGADLADPTESMRGALLFSAHVLASALLLLAVRVIRRPLPAVAEVLAPAAPVALSAPAGAGTGVAAGTMVRDDAAAASLR